jgi:hypothetical protein
MAEKPKKPGLWSRYVGGLLGEDYENMSPEERRTASMSVLGAIGRNMAGAGAGDQALAGIRAGRAAEREAAGLARRQAAAEALMPQVVGRLFGGSAGRLESLPGAPGGELTSRYRQDPRSALAELYRSQAGRDAAQMVPDLAKLGMEGTLGSIVGGSVVNRLTGEVTTPPKAPEAKTPVREVDLGGQVIVYFNDGTTQTFPKGMAPGARAAVGGGGGAAPRAAVGGGAPVAPGGAPGAPGAGNERQQSGRQMTRSAALQYAANITGEPLSKIQRMSPVEIEDLMRRKGGRVLQGAPARMLSGLPLVGDFGKAVIESANADLMAPANQGGAGIAMQQNPTGAITAADVDAGRAQFPNAMYRIDVQAQMIRSILEQGGQVEEYDEKGNKVR